jgi:uridine kinase
MNGCLDDARRLVVARIRELLAGRTEPLLVAVEGQSGAGKSTLARALGAELEATVIDGDDFYAGGSEGDWDARSAAEKADLCIDWRRLRRKAIEPLLAGKPASWHPFDWEAGHGQAETVIVARPAPVVILDGAYSARPELSDLIGLSVLVDVPAAVRRARLVEREGATAVDDWYWRWDDAEIYYFTEVRPPSWFDLVVGNAGSPNP